MLLWVRLEPRQACREAQGILHKRTHGQKGQASAVTPAVGGRGRGPRHADVAEAPGPCCTPNYLCQLLFGLLWSVHSCEALLAAGLGWVGAPQANGKIFKPPPGTVADWRDPFLFEAGGRTLCAIGGGTNDEAQVLLFEADAADESLATWVYRGVLITRPRDCYADRSPHPVRRFFFECPNFLHMQGDTWVLLISPFAPVEYIVGAWPGPK